MTLESKLRALVAELRAIASDCEAHGYTADDRKEDADRIEALLAERQPVDATLLDLAQEILKPHWPVVRNMEENEARQREVERIVNVLKRVAVPALVERPRVCIGYPDCDGDLEGEPHSAKCLATALAERQEPLQSVSRESLVHTGTAVGWYHCDGKDCPICGTAPNAITSTNEAGRRRRSE